MVAVASTSPCALLRRFKGGVREWRSERRVVPGNPQRPVVVVLSARGSACTCCRIRTGRGGCGRPFPGSRAGDAPETIQWSAAPVRVPRPHGSAPSCALLVGVPAAVIASLGRWLRTAEVLRDRSTRAGRPHKLADPSGQLVIHLAPERRQRLVTELHQLAEHVFGVVGGSANSIPASSQHSASSSSPACE